MSLTTDVMRILWLKGVCDIRRERNVNVPQ